MKINKNMLYQRIGERIREWRCEVKLTQGQLADAVGVLRTSITNIEAGRQKAPLHVLYEICAVLGTEMVDLLPSRTAIIQINDTPIEIGGLINEVPEKSADLIQQLLDE